MPALLRSANSTVDDATGKEYGCASDLAAGHCFRNGWPCLWHPHRSEPPSARSVGSTTTSPHEAVECCLWKEFAAPVRWAIATALDAGSTWTEELAKLEGRRIVSVTKATGAEHYVIRKNYEWASIVVRCWEAEEHGKTRHCGEILIHSSYGSWANSWGHCGHQFKQFLTKLDFSYLFVKFMGHKFTVFDGELSRAAPARAPDRSAQGRLRQQG